MVSIDVDCDTALPKWLLEIIDGGQKDALFRRADIKKDIRGIAKGPSLTLCETIMNSI